MKVSNKFFARARQLIVLLAAFYSSASFACNPYMTLGSPYYNPSRFQFVMDNGSRAAGGLTHEQYLEALSKLQRIYDPIFQAKGGELYFPPEDWDNGDVNGTVDRQGTKWRVRVFGGFARHPKTTRDAMLLVTCHEIGHQLAETAYYPNDPYKWAAAEGQADYYSTLKCMRLVLADEDNRAAVDALNVPNRVRTECETQFSDPMDQLICQRGAMAGFQMTTVWESEPYSFSFDRKDETIVTSTYYWHPNNQCRIDTYLAGAACTVPASVDVSKDSYRTGTCNKADGFTSGLRPACWYKEPI
jgi:hypothetical protein